jgi:hypothetical protein
MKKIYESPLNGWDESAERLHVYALESNDEYWELKEMTFGDLCRYFEVCEPGCYVIPGSIYSRYEFKITSNHVIIAETVAYNV